MVHYLLSQDLSVGDSIERMDYNLAVSFLKGDNTNTLKELVLTFAEVQQKGCYFCLNINRKKVKHTFKQFL